MNMVVRPYIKSITVKYALDIKVNALNLKEFDTLQKTKLWLNNNNNKKKKVAIIRYVQKLLSKVVSKCFSW